MIVVAIIGILASVAVPNFQLYQAKSKQVEGKAAVTSIYTAEQAYSIDNSKFSANLTTIGYSKISKYYNIGFAGNQINAPGLTVPLNGNCIVDATGTMFYACALGSVYKGYVDGMHIDQAKKLTAPAAGCLLGVVTTPIGSGAQQCGPPSPPAP